VRPPSDSRISNKKPAGGFLRAGFCNFRDGGRYAGGPGVKSFSSGQQIAENLTQQFWQIAIVWADSPRDEKARRRLRRGLNDIVDGVNMHLICPTRQVAERTY